MLHCNMATGLLFLMVVLPSLVTSDVFTSIDRIKNMVRNEALILDNLRSQLSHDAIFEQFYAQRLQEIRTRNTTDLLQTLEHPNGLYRIIENYANKYSVLRSSVAADAARQPRVRAHLATVADEQDVIGARLSLVRLQTVYNLSASDMISGNYLGYQGPPITALDAFFIGQAAFTDGRPSLSSEWLQTALFLAQGSGHTSGSSDLDLVRVIEVDDKLDLGAGISAMRVKALLGRVILRMGKKDEAMKLLTRAYLKDRNNGEVVLLAEEVKDPRYSQFQEQALTTLEKKFFRLCGKQNQITTDSKDSSLRCRYKKMYLPYFRVGEEIISWSPYVSLFYGVITSSDVERVKEAVREKLFRGAIVESEGQSTNSVRTSHLSFIEDRDSPTVSRVSQRVALLTGLETAISPSGYYTESQSASEPLQVVNYGLGGHYSVHADPIQIVNPATKHMMDNNGDRLATFLIYLSDVERGGSTVFPELDVAVSPRTGSAVFWYSFTPAGQVDMRTLHASCPVVVGEKWVTNKWILNFGNTFTRRCGLQETDTQKDLDADMLAGYKVKGRRTKGRKRSRSGRKGRGRGKKRSGRAGKKQSRKQKPRKLK